MPPKAENGGRSKRWCFTAYCAIDQAPVAFDAGIMRFLVYQREVCPSTNREHWQGYVEFKDTHRRNGVSALFGHRDPATNDWVAHNPHLEVARGSGAENISYCTKDESRMPGTDPVQFGTPALRDGKPVNADDVARIIKEGGGFKEIEEQPGGEGFCLMHYKDVAAAIRREDERNLPNVRDDMWVECWWGGTGTGKTFSALEAYPEAFKKSVTTGKWWDGYNGEKVIIIDEFVGQLPVDWMLQILDPYKLKVEVKGSMIDAKWTTVICTSNIHPSRWWNNFKAVEVEDEQDREELRKAILGRFDHIQYFDGPDRRDIKRRKVEATRGAEMKARRLAMLEKRKTYVEERAAAEDPET